MDMSKQQSNTQRLMEELLGRPLERYVMRARGGDERAAKSWQRIAADLLAETGIHVTAETLRIWFHDAERKRLARVKDAA